ncbi:MAG: PAS domain-containing protein [Halanaerobium sp.]
MTVFLFLDTWLDLIHPDDKEQALQDVDDHLNGKTKKDFREDRRRK